MLTVKFSGEIIYWRGPAPFFFLPTPAKQSKEIKAVSNRLTYGWGCIPVTARIGETEWTTALIPREGAYMVPIKKVIREKLGLDDGVKTSIILEFEEKP
jgi:Domain of unknown function (DUF1905)